MSNILRKIKRNIAQQKGLPRGFFCPKMQNKMAAVQRNIDKIQERVASQEEALDGSSED